MGFTYDNGRIAHWNECLTQIEVSLSTRVAINDNDVHLLGDGLIDLDYIKKGFIGEKIKEYLISKGIDRYVINYNADLVLYGKIKMVVLLKLVFMEWKWNL